jgi:very-short-patch-repair endonuclease
MDEQSPQNDDMCTTLSGVRKELLDFGLRNPLLNYKALKSRGLTIAPIQPREVYQRLVAEARKVSFLSFDQFHPPTSEATSAVLVVRSRSNGHESFQGLPTSHSAEDMDRRLLATYYSAKSSIEEQGVNTLYIALGSLSWSDPAAPQDYHCAPLILIPVELERKSAAEGFSTKYNGEDILPNVCLLEFMKQSQGIEIEAYEESEDLDVDDYFQRVRKAVAHQQGWSVDGTSVALAFFSFAKFLMYRDLDPKTWDNEDALLQHDVLNRLLGNKGFNGDPSPFGETDFVDDYLQQNPLQTVMDADSTQTLALLDVAAGTNLVIQGPPGTGKSQTIVNLIAQALGTGKTVLFVSEKRAALEVVKQRLDKVGLGAACLELHSNKVKKKAVIEELKRTVAFRPNGAADSRDDRAALKESKAHLDDYCSAVNSMVGNAGETVRDLYGTLLPAMECLKDAPIPEILLPGCESWSSGDLDKKRRELQQVQESLVRCPTPRAHIFWGTQLRVVLPFTIDSIRRAAMQAATLSEELFKVAASLSEVIGQKCPQTFTELESFIASARNILDAPDLQGIDTRRDEWKENCAELERALLCGGTLSSLHGQWESVLKPSAWSADVTNVAAVLAELQRKWWKFLSPRWRNAKQQVADLINTPLRKASIDVAAIPNAIVTSQEMGQELCSHESLLKTAFAEHWQGTASDWALLSSQFEWIRSSQKGITDGRFCQWCLDPAVHAVDRSQLETALSDCELVIAEYRQAFNHITEFLKLDLTQNALIAGAVSVTKLADAAEFWKHVSKSAPELENIVRYLQLRDECADDGLAEFAGLTERWTHASGHLLHLFEYLRANQLLNAAFSSNPVLACFDGAVHSRWVATFRDADARGLQKRRALLAERHACSIPRSTSANGQLGILLKEFERKARYLPVRQLMLRAGNAIQAIKPVLMMSPLSVANFLPPGAIEFDLVVFDEASQVRPADALGAIVRGKQAVVVGDSKQLPPTSFFDAMVAGDDATDDDEETATSDIESVLGLFCSRGAHQRMLRWHYRSKHESLIAGSNHLFYDDKLVVFPSPDKGRQNVGLVYRKVTDGTYDRSRTRTNRIEARAIATAVMQHAKEQLQVPRKQRLSLGVAALSKAQMDAIRAELELQRRRQPAYEEFFSDSREQFFVKNLETVQGDERDVILISIGYGRTAEGYLSMSFGPVNRAGGERRLNVLFSRARRRCEVFTSLSADDIDTSQNQSAGLIALKTFLHYAESGQLDVPTFTGGAPQSPFEEQVLAAIQRLGYTVHTQVGSAGFFLDLAVVDPNHPGRYLLGIECDGATYHSARSTRDRDRLRQAVLTGMGWRIHRIWSTSWFRSPEHEMQRLKLAIKATLDGKETLPSPPPVMVSTQPATRPDAKEQQTQTNVSSHEAAKPVKYAFATPIVHLSGLELHKVPATQLSAWLAQVVAVEGPVHWLEAARRVAFSAGVQRVGNRIQGAFRAACRSGVRKGLFLQKKDFLYRVDSSQFVIRDRSDFPPQFKKLEYIAPEEIQAAIELAIQESFGMNKCDVPSAACHLLGFARVTEDMRSVVDQECDYLLSQGSVIARGETLLCNRDGSLAQVAR